MITGQNIYLKNKSSLLFGAALLVLFKNDSNPVLKYKMIGLFEPILGL